ncbi:MAG: hypothetical protein ACOCP4_07540 [Candidatus Woesearchaeota archaeon]
MNWEIINNVATAFACAASIYSIILIRLDKKPKLKISADPGILPHIGSQGFVIFTIINNKEVRNYVHGIEAKINNTKLAFPFLQGEKKIPCSIDPNEQTRFWTPLKDLQEILRERGYNGDHKIIFIVKDGAGKQYKTKTQIKI